MYENPQQDLLSPRLLRRFAAIIYDSLLLFSVLFFAGLLAYPVTRGQSSIIYTIYVWGVSFLYFGWQWLHGGQTLGMRTWFVQLQPTDGYQLTWRHVFIRFLVAILSWLPLGLGFFWALVDEQQRTWHDRASKTRLILLTKE
ncbi:MAG: hypothetical protein BWK79_19975 [Beggiatoa sp. IS2]|nr:MAG: hypothetical protein BWK79_19975 [Beggiatoa sp. IS2]